MASQSGARARRDRSTTGAKSLLRQGPRLCVLLISFLALLFVTLPAGIGFAETAAEAQVREAQRLLKQLALLDPGRYGELDPGAVDGTVGPATRQAIRQFRALEGLPDGGLDESLQRALLAAHAGLTLEGTTEQSVAANLRPESAGLSSLDTRAASELDLPTSTDLAAAIFLPGPVASSAPMPPSTEVNYPISSPPSGRMAGLELAVPLSVALATTLSLILFFVGQRRKSRHLIGLRGGRPPRPGRAMRAAASRQDKLERELLQSFAALPLQHARELRDSLLEELTRVTESKGDGLAVLLSGAMKRLMAEERESYKKIFSNLLFLDRLGRECRAGRLSPDRLDQALQREIELARGPFRLHLLELAEHDRLPQRLPGLWYLVGEKGPEVQPQA